VTRDRYRLAPLVRLVMPKLRSAPTPEEFAKAWTSGFASALKDASSGGRVRRTAAEKIAERDDALRVYGDNAVSWFDESGQGSVNVKKLLGAGYEHALEEGKKVVGPSGRISLIAARSLSSDLVDDFFELRGKSALVAPNWSLTDAERVSIMLESITPGGGAIPSRTRAIDPKTLPAMLRDSLTDAKDEIAPAAFKGFYEVLEPSPKKGAAGYVAHGSGIVIGFAPDGRRIHEEQA
jgi:hypothetical protein